ncbi:MAG TPA: hypothetical protein VIM58_00775, partial [Candidatus Methylacidiphilales bacterium]
ADMYVLAQIGGTELAGGTDPFVMAKAATYLALQNGLRIDDDSRPMVFGRVQDSIDRGLPFMWVCRAGGPTEKWISEWTDRRKKTEWADWVAFVKSRPPLHQAIDGGGHMRMIVGYNAQTHEVAISDSWGSKFVERWLPYDVFEQLTQGLVYTIKW